MSNTTSEEDYLLACKTAAELAELIEAASDACAHIDVRKGARMALKYAHKALSQTKSELEAPDANWLEIAYSAQARKAFAMDAQYMAHRDKELSSRVRDTLTALKDDTSQYIVKAKSAMDKRHYEEALHHVYAALAEIQKKNTD